MRPFSLEQRFAASELAKADLYFFSRWMFQLRKGFPWSRATHHKIICDALMRVFNGECKRLIINVPPRYSKTELAVVNFIAWCMGQVPDSEFIHASYSGDLAANNSANVRGLVQHEGYREIFPAVQLSGTAQSHWKTTLGGIMYAAGAGGTITGFGAGKHREGFGGAIIIDDPHKPDEARSDTIRQNVIDWFQNTLESRRNSPQTPIILIMQRLHEHDLAGWLLAGKNGEVWESVVLDAIQPNDIALWPEKHTIDDLHRMERAAPYTFAGQYRQRPAPPEGGLIKPDKMQIVDAIPAGQITWVRGWDLADSLAGDYTVGARIGKFPDGRFIISHMARDRVLTDERDALIKNAAASDGRLVRISLPQDPGQAGKTQVLYLTRALAGYPVKSSPESGDKITRAEPMASQINVGNVMMLRGHWNDALIDEMRLFPNGEYDDQVDACSRAFSELIAPPEAAKRVDLLHMRR